MAIAENEALSCLRVLVAVARADGAIHEHERKSLSAALSALELPAGTTIDGLLAEEIDLDRELAAIATDEARQQVYRSAYFMAHADGACRKEEEAILAKVAEAVGVTQEQRASLDGVFVGRVSEPSLFGNGSMTISDPAEREAKIRSHTLKYSVMTAVLGAFPIPGVALATDFGVIALQLKMVRDIGAFWGQNVDSKGARSLLYSLGLGTGARLAIGNLAKLVPGWGSAVGATTSFASTYALGGVIDKLFASGEKDVTAAAALKDEFEAKKKEGQKVYAEQKDAIAESKRNAAPALEALASDLRAGKITQAEFDERVSRLG